MQVEAFRPGVPGAVDAAWRAALYCFLPRVMWLSCLPLLIAGVTLGGLAWWGWDDANVAVRAALDGWAISHTLLSWLDDMGWGGLRAMLVPVLLVLMAVPLVVVVCLLLVAALMTPALVALVRARRLPVLQSRHTAPWWRPLLWSGGATVVALGALVLTLPLWFVPMFAFLGPPLIWGWLTYRVMAFDTLADLATPDEQQRLLRQHRTSLLLMGVACGYLGAAPAALWALGALTLVFAPLVLVVSVWLYTLVFAFSSLWFAHYLLAALAALRSAAPQGPAPEPQPTSALPTPP
jgi:hypothetical protein